MAKVRSRQETGNLFIDFRYEGVRCREQTLLRDTPANRKKLETLSTQGKPIVVSGYVLVPKGEPPEGGWPVLAWAHGTTGVADICALSGVYQDGPAYSYHAAAMGALDPWLEQGYAVVATDYQGLGTPGGHPYMNADSQLHTVVDSVRAAHHLLPDSLSANWLVLGHSQGGAAALAVAAGGQAYGSELQLQGAIAAAPGGMTMPALHSMCWTTPSWHRAWLRFFPSYCWVRLLPSRPFSWIS